MFDRSLCGYVTFALTLAFSKVQPVTELSTSELIPYSHEYSLHFSSCLRPQADFHVYSVGMFVTDCFCFLFGTKGLIWVTFLKVPDSVMTDDLVVVDA